MPTAEGFVMLCVPEDIRRILKHASAESAQPIYRIICDLVYHAYPQYATSPPSTHETESHAS